MAEKNRVFIITQNDRSYKYGVGKYVKQILKQAEKEISIEIIFVLLGALVKKIEKKTVNSNTYFHIPKPAFFYDKDSENLLSVSYSKAIYILLNDFFEIKKTDIFHFNDNTQHIILRNIKRDTKAKIIYTIHVSLWKIFYNNNKALLIQGLKSEIEENESLYKRSITSEIQNCKLADKVICLSDDMFDDVVDIYDIPKAKVQKIYNGIQIPQLPQTIKGKKDMGFNLEDFVLLFVGRLEENKGIRFLIEAFHILIENTNKSLHLVVVGDGTKKKGLEKLCADFNESVSFTGYIEPEKVSQYYMMADAIVFPSLNEQSSYVMLEAMSYRLPLIVTDIPAFNMLKNKDSCLKVSVTKNSIDVEELSTLIELLVVNESLRNTIAENAHSLFLQEYTAKKMFYKTYTNLF